MGNQRQLAVAIDRLVEESIRRILPRVMNEVLVRTLVESGALERRETPVHATVRETARPTRRTGTRQDLGSLLDDSIGADAYEVRAASREPTPASIVPEASSASPPLVRRMAALDPMLQEMAEGLVVPADDGGEMWEEGEYDSVSVTPGPQVADIAAATARAGIDMSRMRALVERTSAPQRVDAEDATARAAFETQRLRRLRERLNGGKPVMD